MTRTLAQLRSFVVIGVASTIAYAALYNAARGATTPSFANLLALAVTAVANTAANRRFTFGVHGRGRALRDQLGGMLAFAVALLVTNSAIVALHVLAPAAPRSIEVATLVAANLLATFIRFVLLRAWIAGGRTYQMEDLR
jgi:putative flippase GtrA